MNATINCRKRIFAYKPPLLGFKEAARGRPGLIGGIAPNGGLVMRGTERIPCVHTNPRHFYLRNDRSLRALASQSHPQCIRAVLVGIKTPSRRRLLLAGSPFRDAFGDEVDRVVCRGFLVKSRPRTFEE